MTNPYHLTPEALAMIKQRASEFRTRVACMRALREVREPHPMAATLRAAHASAQSKRFEG